MATNLTKMMWLRKSERKDECYNGLPPTSSPHHDNMKTNTFYVEHDVLQYNEFDALEHDVGMGPNISCP